MPAVTHASAATGVTGSGSNPLDGGADSQPVRIGALVTVPVWRKS